MPRINERPLSLREAQWSEYYAAALTGYSTRSADARWVETSARHLADEALDVHEHKWGFFEVKEALGPNRLPVKIDG